MAINLTKGYLTPLAWFDRHVLSEVEGLTTSGAIIPLILSLSKEMSGIMIPTKASKYSV